MTAIDRAKDLLAALRRKCNYTSERTCVICEARITAEVYLEGMGSDTLRVLIVEAEALEKQMNCNACNAGGEYANDPEPCTCEVDAHKALAEVEKLFPEEAKA